MQCKYNTGHVPLELWFAFDWNASFVGRSRGGDNLCFGLKDYVVLIRFSCNKGNNL